MTPEVTRQDKPKKRKKPKKQSQLKQADALWGQLIRAPGRCIECGSTSNVQAAHCIGRAYRKVRHDPRNGVPLCAHHHVFWTHRPLEWDDWLRAHWGQELYDEMRDLALNGPRVDLKKTIENLRLRLAMVEAGTAQ